MHALPPNLRNLLRRRSRLTLLVAGNETPASSATPFRGYEVVVFRSVRAFICMERASVFAGVYHIFLSRSQSSVVDNFDVKITDTLLYLTDLLRNDVELATTSYVEDAVRFACGRNVM